METVLSIIKILFFPGLLFLLVAAMLAEYIDRKACAHMQNRIGPPWYQPLADVLKLLGKKTIIPKNAGKALFRALPSVSFAAVATAFLSIPVWGSHAVVEFEGDIVVILYLLTIPTVCLFLAGWNSHNVYASMGSFRTLTQMFAYEVPLFMVLLTPALIAGTWSVSGILLYYSENPLYTLINIPAFIIALIISQGKLERPPFDAPEAETEIVGGALVEYSGRYLAIFRMAADSELIVVVSLLAALFLPFITGIAWIDFILYIVKILALILILAVVKVSMARIRMDQMLHFCWWVLTPIAAVEIIVILIVNGGIAL